MKVILLIAISLALCGIKLDAQVTRPPMYDTCNYLRPLEGEWVNINGSDTIKIYLRFHRSFYSDPETYNHISDNLWGWVEYRQGSTLIMSDYTNRFAALPYNVDDLSVGLKSISLWAGRASGVMVPVGYEGCQNPITELGGSISDIAKCRTSKMIMATVNGSGPGAQMTWWVYAVGSETLGCEGTTLPTTFVLTKQ